MATFVLINLLFHQSKPYTMPKYLIERDIPGIQQMTSRDLQAISLKSRNILEALGPQIQWLQSYVMNNKLFCVYVAPNPEMIKEHASRGKFPVSHINEVKAIIDSTSADGYIFDKHN
jgi:hypothetical protein